MPTYVQRELAGVSPIIEPALPTDPDLGNKKDEAKLHRREAKELRLLNNDIVPYKKDRELTDILGNPKDNIMKQLNSGNYKVITNEEAMHVPYKLAA